MPAKIYKVKLSSEEREELNGLVNKGPSAPISPPDGRARPPMSTYRCAGAVPVRAIKTRSGATSSGARDAWA